MLLGMNVAGIFAVLAGIIIVGVSIGQLTIRGIGIGVAATLFVGLAIGYFCWGQDAAISGRMTGLTQVDVQDGMLARLHILGYVRDFGLVLFIYAVGTNAGPHVIRGWRSSAWQWHALAAGMVLAGFLLAWATIRLTHLPLPLVAGMLAGAVTNTPSLAAIHQTLGSLPNIDAPAHALPGLGYALAYPVGVLATVVMVGMMRLAQHRGLQADDQTTVAVEATARDVAHMDLPQLVPMFLIIGLGIVLGQIPIPVAGLPAPIVLGMAGGPLIVSMLGGWIGRIGPLSFRMPPSSISLIRDLGLALFLASVGLLSGQTLAHDSVAIASAQVIGFAALITCVPLGVGWCIGHMLGICPDRLAGLIAAFHTSPPALALADATAGTTFPSQTYATVYPMVMLMRVIGMQLFIVLLHASGY